jgi:hypothetical protein
MGSREEVNVEYIAAKTMIIAVREREQIFLLGMVVQQRKTVLL